MSVNPSTFTTTITTTAGVITVAVSGEFDGASVQSFEAVCGRVDILRPELVVLDIAGVSLLDSAGIGAIMRFRQRFVDLSTELHIVAPRPFQQRLFEITGLSHILKT